MSDDGAGGGRRWAVRLAVFAGLVAVGVALRSTLFAPKPVEVRVVAVERGRVEATLTNSKAGTVRARLRSRLTAETGGRVVEIAHREGEHVNAGELLVRLNDSSLRAQHDLARRGVEVASSRLEEACLRRDRASRELVPHQETRRAQHRLRGRARRIAVRAMTPHASTCLAAEAELGERPRERAKLPSPNSTRPDDPRTLRWRGGRGQYPRWASG